MKSLLQTIVVATAALLFTACNTNNSNQTATDGDTTAAVTEQAAPSESVFIEQGLPPVVIGAKVKDLPESVDGLYASKKYHQIDPNLDDEQIGWDEVEGWYFYDKDGNLLFTAEENNGTIYRVTAKSPTLKTAQGAHVGMSRDEALKIEGTKLIKPNPEADYQIYTIEIGNISMTLDYENSQKVISMEVADYSVLE